MSTWDFNQWALVVLAVIGFLSLCMMVLTNFIQAFYASLKVCVREHHEFKRFLRELRKDEPPRKLEAATVSPRLSPDR